MHPLAIFSKGGWLVPGAGNLRLIAVACVLLCISWLMTFENVNEIKFFGEGWVYFAGLPFELFLATFQGPEDKFLILPCNELSNLKLLQTTQNPILFKGCIPDPKNMTLEGDFVAFPKSQTNIFPSCGNKTVVREFTYASLDKHVVEIHEKIPCASSTLAEKSDFFFQYDPEKDGAYFDVHVFLPNREEIRQLETIFVQKRLLPDGFTFPFHWTVFLVHFFASGTTAVDYFHSHMDRFVSFGIQATKVWELINPKHISSFEYVWSGNALVLTEEKEAAPRVVIAQEPGDILFVAPWWLHKTSYPDPTKTLQTKNANFNLHFTTMRSISGVAAAVFMKWLNMPTWFYDSATNQDSFRKYGL